MMKIVSGDTNFKFNNTAITLGKFDGLHLGHQLLMNMVKSYKNRGYNSLMFTFNMHPTSVLTDKNIKLLYTEEEKINLAKRYGMDIFISYPFTDEVRSMLAEDFITNILVKQLDVKVIVVGADYRFGFKRMGNVDLLKEYGKKYNFEVVVFDKLKINDNIVSSSIIRDALEHGDLDKVNILLGRPFSISGVVEHGNRIGRTLGVPTINILPNSNKKLPLNGVYISEIVIEDKKYKSVTSIGFKPTVTDEKKIWIETFVLDFNEEIYGKNVEVELLKQLREEIKFNSIDELKQQMEKDVVHTKQFFDINHN